MQHDELFKFGPSHHLLKTMQEGLLQFDPTYKYDFGTSNYDTSNKNRVPAWTDRVLFGQRPQAASLKLMHYLSTKELSISDHKPVIAIFRAKVRKIDAQAKALCEQNLIQKFMVMK